MFVARYQAEKHVFNVSTVNFLNRQDIFHHSHIQTVSEYLKVAAKQVISEQVCIRLGSGKAEDRGHQSKQGNY